MQYFGKDVVNYLLMFYIALGGTIGVKSLVTSFLGDRFDAYDQNLIIDFAIKKIDLEVQMTQLDIVCCIISCF
jgi:minor histocompatibility antigen H13